MIFKNSKPYLVNAAKIPHWKINYPSEEKIKLWEDNFEIFSNIIKVYSLIVMFGNQIFIQKISSESWKTHMCQRPMKIF